MQSKVPLVFRLRLAFDIDQQFQIINPLTNETEYFDLSAGEMYHLLLAVGEMGESSLVPEAGEVPQKHYYKAASFNPIIFVSNDKPSATTTSKPPLKTTTTPSNSSVSFLPSGTLFILLSFTLALK